MFSNKAQSDMKAEKLETVAPESASTLTVGAQLREAREAGNMSASHVASLLRLDTTVVTALEADDLDALPSATFVKGYLRSYARLVGLDGESLVSAYSDKAAPDDSLLKASGISDGQHKKPKWLVLLALFLFVALFGWYVTTPKEQPVSTDSLRANQSLVSEAQPPLTTLAEITSEGLGSDDADVIEVRPEPSLEPLASDGLSEAVVAKPVEAEPTVTLTADDADENAGFISLRIQGQALSWVSIRDAKEKRLFRDNLKPGESYELTGFPPIVVNLGNGAGVKLFVNGQPYKHNDWHKPNGTARFVLNPTP